MAINDVLARIARKVGLKPADASDPERMTQQLLTSQAMNVDHIEKLKDEIRTLEARALKKKKEMDATRGDSKRMVASEIERTFKQLDLVRGREFIYARNLDQISLALAKLGEIQAARSSGLTDSVIDDIGITADEEFATLSDADKALKDMNKTNYNPPATDAMDLDARFKDMEENPIETDPPEKKTTLSLDAQRRLKELESEE